MNYDRKRMTKTLHNISHDLLKHPGQLDLKEDEKFALTMMMLSRLNAVIIAAQAPSKLAAEALLDMMVAETTKEMHRAGAIIATARMMGFGTTIPWDTLRGILEDDDDEGTDRPEDQGDPVAGQA